MARKRPSRHTDDQFGLFLERVRESLDREDGQRFHEAVSRILHNSDRKNGSAQEPGPLPGRIGFEAVEAAAESTAGARDALMLWTGKLVFSWSNNERLLIYLLMLLTGSDEHTVTIIFATLNTVRDRLELISRLVLFKVPDPAIRRDLEGILERLTVAARIRNEFLYTAYSVNDRGEITHAQAMFLMEERNKKPIGDRPIEQHISELRHISEELASINRALWDLLPRLRQQIGFPELKE